MCLATVLWKSEKGCGVVVLESGEMAFARSDIMEKYEEHDLLDVVCEHDDGLITVTEAKKFAISPQA